MFRSDGAHNSDKSNSKVNTGNTRDAMFRSDGAHDSDKPNSKVEKTKKFHIPE